MARRAKDVTEAELDVLEVLWSRGPATIRQITEVLHPGGGTSAYATVQKLLQRLEGKCHVRRRRGAAAHVFLHTVDRQELVGRRIQAISERLCGGSLTPVITHLVQSSRLTQDERDALRQLVARATGAAGSRPESP